MVGFNIQNTVMMFPNSFGGAMDISDRSGNRSSPGSSIGSSQSPGALSDASARIAQVVRGLLRSERSGLSHIPGFSFSLPPSGTAVS